MGKIYDHLEPRLIEWILAQPMFFVATAPLAADGHVNVSPKGLDGSLIVLGPNRLAYLDVTGSGAETIAHLRENGRIVVMLCGFSGPPQTVRMHGHGIVHPAGTNGFAELHCKFSQRREHNVRSIIEVEIDRISDSCGFSVPLMTYEGQRDLLIKWADRKSPKELGAYRAKNNTLSIDAQPALG
jgi:hypothetical protein